MGKTAKARTITLYTKAGCTLCDETEHAVRACLRGWDVAFERIDITEDPALMERYGHVIPVVAVDGEPLFVGGKVSPWRLRTLLATGEVSRRYREFVGRLTRRQ